MNGTLNKVILIGRMGEKVKLTYFNEGSCIGQFPLATDDEYLNRATNERIVTAEWHNIVVRNKLAEIVERYTHKGDLIYVEGKIWTRKWQAEDGTMRNLTEIQASEVNFLPNRREGRSSYQAEIEKEDPDVSTTPLF